MDLLEQSRGHAGVMRSNLQDDCTAISVAYSKLRDGRVDELEAAEEHYASGLSKVPLGKQALKSVAKSVEYRLPSVLIPAILVVSLQLI